MYQSYKIAPPVNYFKGPGVVTRALIDSAPLSFMSHTIHIQRKVWYVCRYVKTEKNINFAQHCTVSCFILFFFCFRWVDILIYNAEHTW